MCMDCNGAKWMMSRRVEGPDGMGREGTGRERGGEEEVRERKGSEWG